MQFLRLLALGLLAQAGKGKECARGLQLPLPCAGCRVGESELGWCTRIMLLPKKSSKNRTPTLHLSFWFHLQMEKKARSRVNGLNDSRAS